MAGGYPPELAWGRVQGRVGQAGWSRLGGRGVREAGERARGGVQGRRFRGGRWYRHGFKGRSTFRKVCRIFVVSNTYKKKKILKDALWGGGGTHRSWPGGRTRGGLGLGWLFQRGASSGKGSGKGWLGGRGGCKGFGCGGVGGRGTGPGRSKFRNVCRIFANAYKKKKNGFF